MTGAVLLHAVPHTELKGRIPRLTKRIFAKPDGAVEIESYQPGAKWYRPEMVGFENLRQLANILEVLEKDPHACLVRGDLLPEALVIAETGGAIRRRLLPDGEEQPTFQPALRQWVMIDLDKLPAPDGIDPTQDPKAAIEYLLSLLPAGFEAADCYWQWSSSQGFKGRLLSAHLWFWLDRAYSDDELKVWAEPVNAAWKTAHPDGRNLIDTALFNPVQVHYTAAPVFDKVDDPLPLRAGWREGRERAVTLVTPGVGFENTGGAIPRTIPSLRVPGKGLDEHFDAIGPGNFFNGINSAAGALVRDAADAGGDIPALIHELEALTKADPGGEGEPGPLVVELKDAVQQAYKRHGITKPSRPYDRTRDLRKLILRLLKAESGKSDSATTRRPRLIEADPEPWPEEQEPEAAQVRLDALVNSWIDRAVEPTEPVNPLLLNVSAGLGKSAATRRAIARKVREGLLGDIGGVGLRQRAVWYLVDKIRLGFEAADDFKKHGVRCAVIRGRTQKEDNPPPNHPELAAPLCRRAGVIEQAMKAGVQDIERRFCEVEVKGEDGSTVRVDRCPDRVGCPYYAQFDHEADVYVMAHDRAFTPPGETKVPPPALVVVDENIMSSLIATGWPFTRPELVRSAGEFGHIAEAIAAALEDGADPFATLRKFDLTPHKLEEMAATLAGEAEDALDLSPEDDDKTAADKLNRVPRLYAVRVFRRLADEWRANPQKTEARSLIFERGAEVMIGGEVRIMDVFWTQYRKKTRGLQKAPVLLLDATADPDLLRVAFPGLQAESVVARRNFKVVQAEGFAASKGAMTHEKAETYGAEIGGILNRVAAEAPGPGLLITHKDAKANVPLPEGWEAEHFGAIRGIDRYKNVSAIAVVGRMTPPPKVVERLARGLLYDTDEPLLTLSEDEEGRPQWYPEVKTWWRMRDGWRKETQVNRHPCPWAERFRWQACEAELLQGIDRARLIWRDKPALVVLVNEVPLPEVPVDNLVNYRALAGREGRNGAGGRDRLAVAMERLGGVLPTNTKWLAERFPDLWKTDKAVEMDLRRAQGRLAGGCVGIKTLEYVIDSYKDSRVFRDHVASTAVTRKGAALAAGAPPILGGEPLRAHRYEYRSPGQRGRPSAIYSWRGAAEVRQFIEAVFGEGVVMTTPTLVAVPSMPISGSGLTEVRPLVATGRAMARPSPSTSCGTRRPAAGPLPPALGEWLSGYAVYRAERWGVKVWGLPRPVYRRPAPGLRDRRG
ncbi:hypothetical protein GAY31_18865 [Azospirillum brasilense]|nr:hypothetical protein [Azospirillum brasilense]